MVLTVILILVVAAFVCLLAGAIRAEPVRWWGLWVAVLLLTIIELLRALPLGK